MGGPEFRPRRPERQSRMGARVRAEIRPNQCGIDKRAMVGICSSHMSPFGRAPDVDLQRLATVGKTCLTGWRINHQDRRLDPARREPRLLELASNRNNVLICRLTTIQLNACMLRVIDPSPGGDDSLYFL